MPYGLLDSLSPDDVAAAGCNEHMAVDLAARLPSPLSGLLAWVVSLMADVAENEPSNRMSARNMCLRPT